MKVGDLVSCNMFAGPGVDDIGVIVPSRKRVSLR